MATPSQQAYDLLDADIGGPDKPVEASQQAYDLLDSPTQSPDERAALSGSMEHKPFESPDYSVRTKMITESVKKGVADFAALPGYAVDAADWANKIKYGRTLEKQGVEWPDNEFATSAQIKKGWDMLLQREDVEPRNAAEQYVGKAAEFVGSGLPMSARMLAQEALKLAGQGLPKKAIASELSKLFATDIASGVSGGLAAENLGSILASALGEDWRMVGEMVGGISGGAVPWYARNVAGGLRNAVDNSRNPEAKNAIVENMAKNEIEAAIGESPRSAQNIERSMELKQTIENFNPNLAAATDSPGIEAFQRGYDQKSMTNFNQSAEMIEGSTTAIDDYYRSVMPTLDDEITPFLKGRYAKAVDVTRKRLSSIDRKTAGLEAAFERRPSRAIGARLREVKQEQYKNAKNKKNQHYDDLYKAAEEDGVFADVSDIRRTVQDIKASDKNIFQSMPGISTKIENLIPADNLTRSVIMGADGTPITTVFPTAKFEPIHSLMKEINTEYAAALRIGDSTKEYYLSKIRKVVNSKIKGFDDPIYGSFAAHKQAVDSWWLNEYYNVFKQGLGANISRKTKWGDRTADEDVVNTYVLGKGSDGIDQFNKVFEGVPEAQILLREGIIDSLGSKIELQGLDQKVIDAFLHNNREVFDVLPDLRNALSNTGVAVDVLAKRRTEVAKLRERLISSSNNVHAKAAGFDDIEEAIASSFKNKEVKQLLTRSAKSDTQKQNLATGYAEHVLAQKNPWGYLTKNEKTLKPILNKLGPAHYKNLTDIAEAYNIMNRYQLPGRLAPQMGDPVKRATGTSLVSGFAQMRWAFFYGKTSVVYPFVDIGSKFLYKKGRNAIDDVIEKAMYNPDLAKTLASLSKRKTVTLKQWKKVSKYIIGSRIRAASVAANNMETEEAQQ